MTTVNEGSPGGRAKHWHSGYFYRSLEETVAGTRQAPRAVWAFLVILLVASFALRAWYASGWLQPGRFWDENVNVQNVTHLLYLGRFEPANGFYPTLAYVPQTLVMAAVEAVDSLIGADKIELIRNNTFTSQAYFVARLVGCVYGVASLLMTYLIGARLFSNMVGLAGATILACSPWHIHTSAYFKPDNLVTLMLLVFLYASAAVVARPSRWRFATAGVMIGLAMSSKFTAACAPLTLSLAALLHLRRDRKVFLYLIFAGLISLATFLVLNPQLDLFQRDFGWTVYDYAKHATHEQTTRTELVAGALAFPFDRFAHGFVWAAASILGALILLGLLASRKISWERRASWILLLTFPFFLILTYAAGTHRLKTNNFMPVLPITSLLAAVALCCALRMVAGLAPRRRDLWVGVSAVVLTSATLGPGGFFYAYRSMIPTTEDAAFGFIADQLGHSAEDLTGRLVYGFEWQRPELAWEGQRATTIAFPAIASPEAIDSTRLDYADGWILPERWLRAEGGLRALRGIGSHGISVMRLKPRPFALRGPDLVAVAHPWEIEQPPEALAVRISPDGGIGAALPAELDAGGVWSLLVWIKISAFDSEKPVSMRVGEHEVNLHYSSKSGQGLVFASERFEPPEPNLEARYPYASRVEDLQIYLIRWRRPDWMPAGGTSPDAVTGAP